MLKNTFKYLINLLLTPKLLQLKKKHGVKYQFILFYSNLIYSDFHNTYHSKVMLKKCINFINILC